MSFAQTHMDSSPCAIRILGIPSIIIQLTLPHVFPILHPTFLSVAALYHSYSDLIGQEMIESKWEKNKTATLGEVCLH